MSSSPGGIVGLWRSFVRIGYTCALGAAVLLASFLGYRVAKNQIAGEIYLDRLKALTGEYEALRSLYNEAVRRTAVTELVVEGGKLSVRVAGPEGTERVVETPYDPRREVYVDYVVVQGRLWIRRVFDEQTAPEKGVVITPPLEGVDWSDPRFAVGKAVYRSLGEGRWVVTVTGDGSLGLARAPEGDPVRLAPAPEVRDYDTLRKQLAKELDEIDAGDVLREVVGGRRQ
jgi:hypothetical protein